jgi:hypothetical protein
MKYTIHSTKSDFQELYEYISKLETKLGITLNWKKVKAASFDSLTVLMHGLESRLGIGRIL